MTLYAGIDGGQSSSVAAIGDATRVLGRGIGPAADLVGERRDSGRQRDALEAALSAALAAAGLDPATRFAAVVAGISGFDAGISRLPDLGARSDRTRIVHDTEIAHAGALDGAPGIVVIAGTGSVALGNASGGGPFVRAGGWGYFFGDEGSALWIARLGLRQAMAAFDRGASSRLGDRALAFFGAHALRDIQHAFAHGELTRSALAAFAGEVFALAAEGDPESNALRDMAAGSLTEIASGVDARLPRDGARRISYAGGVFASADFAQRFADSVRGRIPGADVTTPANDPAAGALTLARALG